MSSNRRPLVVLDGRPVRYREIELTTESNVVEWGEVAGRRQRLPLAVEVVITHLDGSLDSRRYGRYEWTRRHSGRGMYSFSSRGEGA